MMRGLLSLFGALFLVLSLSFVSAQTQCTLDVRLINQDPFPAIPGDYVELVFQLDGISNPACRDVSFELLEEYPISFDPDDESKVVVPAGTYSNEFSSFYLATHRVRVSEDALDGVNPIEVRYGSNVATNSVFQTKKFDLEVQDVRTNFEVSIKDYDPQTKSIIFEILNIGESDAEALTIEIPEQDNFEVKGSQRNIVGSLDSNEDTTFTFEGTPKDGTITLRVIYSDEINVRREMQKEVVFESSNFEGRTTSSRPLSFYLLIILILFLVGRFAWKFYHKRKRKKQIHN